jgi:alkylation response protein AidB-like acyl-CoA dehydrogenase
MLAAESAAGIEKVLLDAVEYAKQRVAFGRPIGAFQAIKHQLAEVVGLSECSTAGVHYAAWALTENDPRASLACAMAQSYASEAYRDATHRNIQIFGAIGFTWQMPNHLYYKRARANAELLGAARWQRERVIQLLEEQKELIAA